MNYVYKIPERSEILRTRDMRSDLEKTETYFHKFLGVTL